MDFLRVFVLSVLSFFISSIYLGFIIGVTAVGMYPAYRYLKRKGCPYAPVVMMAPVFLMGVFLTIRDVTSFGTSFISFLSVAVLLLSAYKKKPQVMVGFIAFFISAIGAILNLIVISPFTIAVQMIGSFMCSYLVIQILIEEVEGTGKVILLSIIQLIVILPFVLYFVPSDENSSGEEFVYE